MKRIGFIYETLCTTEILNLALDRAVKGKRKTPWIRHVLNNREKFIGRLQQQLTNQQFVPGYNKIKVIVEQASGKERKLIIPRFFPDRVVHWAVCICLNRVFMRGMYRYCVGSVPYRGGKAGKRYVRRVLERGNVKYVAQWDIRKFFQSVNQNKVKELLRRKIKDKKMLRLLDMIIDAGQEGLPIGYYTSQWLSNYYLEPLDHFIKQGRHIPYYVRNVDDGLMLGANKRKLHKTIRAIDEFLRDGYAVRLKPTWQVWKNYSRPINYLGICIYKDKILLRKRNFLRFMRQVKKVKKRGYCTVGAARGIMSRLGGLKELPHGRKFYLKYIKPIISKGECRRIISRADKRRKIKVRSDNYMIVKSGTNQRVEGYKKKLGLSGDVYIVNHFIASLESHKKLIEDSTATTIEEAEVERIAYEERLEAERLAAVEAAAQAADQEETEASESTEGGYDS